MITSCWCIKSPFRKGPLSLRQGLFRRTLRLTPAAPLPEVKFFEGHVGSSRERVSLMNKNLLTLLALLLLAVCGSQPAAAGTNEQIIQIQVTVKMLQENMALMQQSMDERMGVLKNMMAMQTDNVNKTGVAVQNLQKTLGAQTTDSATKVDQISGQVQALHDAVDELKARLVKLGKQLDDMQAARQNIGSPSPNATGTGNVAPAPPRPVK